MILINNANYSIKIRIQSKQASMHKTPHGIGDSGHPHSKTYCMNQSHKYHTHFIIAGSGKPSRLPAAPIRAPLNISPVH